MKSYVSKTEAQETITKFFANQNFTPEELKKIKRLAMKYNIKLKKYKKLFCKNCFSHLKGKTRITKAYKKIICNNCKYINKWKL